MRRHQNSKNPFVYEGFIKLTESDKNKIKIAFVKQFLYKNKPAKLLKIWYVISTVTKKVIVKIVGKNAIVLFFKLKSIDYLFNE